MYTRTPALCLVLLAGCNLFGATPNPVTDVGGEDGGVPLDMHAEDTSAVDGDTPDLSTSDVVEPVDYGGDMDMGRCMTNGACPRQLACIDGACVARLDVGETCTESDDCESGLCTSEGACEGFVAPLARYRVNEAAAGTAPTLLRDDTADPLDLGINYEGVSGFMTDREGNRYARFVGAQTGGSAPIVGTKIEAAFDEATTGTLEVKSMTLLCTNNQHRVFGMGTGGVPSLDGWFTLREFGANDYIYVKFLPNTVPTQLRPTSMDGCLTAAPVVTHVVVDTTSPLETERVRLYVDGRRIALQRDSMAAPFPTLSQALDIGLPATKRHIFLGRPNPESGGRTTDQRIWYGAAYDVPLSDALIQRNAARLLLRDDEDTNRGIITRTVGDAGDFASLDAWYAARSGDLTRRIVVATTDSSGEFAAGERVSSPDGCGGIALAETRDGTRAGLLTLDEFESGCVENALLTGANSGATARFGGILLRGTIERAAIIDSTAAGAVLDNSITDADHYLVVTAASDMMHRGMPGNGAAIQPNADGLRVAVPFTRVEQLRIANTPAGSSGLRIDADDVTIRNVLIEGSEADAIHVAADRTVIEDSIVFAAGQHAIVHDSGDGVVLRNLTVVQSGGVGIQSVGGATVQNVIAEGSPAFASDAAWALASNNISTDGSAPGADSLVNVSSAKLFESVTAGAEDFHLAIDSPAIDAGTDTGVVSWDIALEARRDAWDIGAFSE